MVHNALLISKHQRDAEGAMEARQVVGMQIQPRIRLSI